MGAHWIVQEGYLQFKVDGHNGPNGVHRAALRERYVVLYMNRKIEMFESSTKDPSQRLDACYLRAFCGWDGEGLLKAGESYGLEWKVEKHAQTRLFVAAFNRLDLEKWCRGFVAVLDPESAAGQEVRRERRKARKEEKRALEEREVKIRQWEEQQRRMRDEEILRLQQREEEIQNMTPLERIDGLGSLDDDTARMLEKRRQRQQRRQAPTTRRVNKAAYRQRLDDAAGGKLENVQPLQARPVQEQRGKVRVEAPAPGQYIEASGASSSSTRRHSNPARRRRLDSTDGSGSGSDFSRDSRMSSGPFSTGSRSGSIPPPPPPPRSEFDDSRSDFIPPPPPSVSGQRRDSRSQSLRGSFYDESELSSSRLSMSQSSRQLWGAEGETPNIQASLAAILGGRKMPPRGNEKLHRHDSFESTADSTANGEVASVSRTNRGKATSGETTATNAFAASLAAIRRNRTDTVDDSRSVDMPPSSRRRDRKRDTQLSAEGKAILQKAISMDEPFTPARKKDTANGGGRKGLFDDSSSDEEDSDAGIFGMRKSTATKARPEGNERLSVKAGRHHHARTPYAEEDDDDDDDNDGHLDSFKQSAPSDFTSPQSATSPLSVSHGNFYSQPKSVDVVYTSGVLQNQGKKAVVVYTFAFRSGHAEHSFSHSYHEFDAIHQRLSSEALPRLPKFPSKHLLRNFTKPENMQRRAMEFVQYFQALVAIPGIFDNKRFLFEFQISDDFVRVVLGGGSSGASTSQATPTSTRTPKPYHRTKAVVVTTDGGKSRATALFGADDTDSDADSVSMPLTTPKKSLPPPSATRLAPEAEPKRKKKSKPSRRDFEEEEDVTPVPVTSDRRDRARSKNSVKSIVNSTPAEPAVPKIAGLPARPNLFGGGRGDLLAAIRQGAALKKADGDSEVAAPAGRGAGFPAPLSAPPPPPPPPRPAPLANAGSVAEAITNAMAARRIHVEYEDKSDDSDDDWD